MVGKSCPEKLKLITNKIKGEEGGWTIRDPNLALKAASGGVVTFDIKRRSCCLETAEHNEFYQGKETRGAQKLARAESMDTW